MAAKNGERRGKNQSCTRRNPKSEMQAAANERNAAFMLRSGALRRDNR
jgi:hypothetical protein